MHRSGFVNILGHPNVGKSTLMNALVGERMSIVSAKPQTTRHRILGILSGDDFQIVFSDTPGFVIRPSYRMHEKMNAFVSGAFEDADLVLLVTEPGDVYEADDPLLHF
nr:50S ribosome-binding GTPase [Saprospiraceae bacterium]